jgi:hypothetical protein
MLCILGDMGRSTIGNWWYQLGPGVGTWKVGGDGEHMGWSGVWVEVDGVGSGTLAGSTCMGNGGRTMGAGAGTGAGARGTGAGASGTGASIGAGTGAGARGASCKRKFGGPGS